MLREAGFTHVVSTRSESRTRDGMGIDLMNTNEEKNGRLPYNIQCKNYARKVEYHDLLAGLPDDEGVINVVLHKFTEKKKGGNFHPKGHYAILNMEDFFYLITELKKLEKLVAFAAK